MTHLITQADLRSIALTVGIDRLMDEAIAAIHDAFCRYDQSRTEVRKREGFRLQNQRESVLEWMPIQETGEVVTMKLVSYNPANPERSGLPTVIASNSLYDVKTGRLLALMDGVFPTALRTGAASAVATRLLAHPDSRCVGIVGCGAQAVTQLHALSRVLRIARVRVHDVNPRHQASFPQRVSFLGLDVRPSSLAELCAEADVLCTATSVPPGGGPVLVDKDLAPHLHVNAVGSDLPGKTELPLSLLERSLVCPDYLPQAVEEGECQQLRPDQIGPTIVDVAKDPARFERWRTQSTVFDSTGFALEDQVITRIFWRYAQELGLGTEVALESTGSALNPYDFLAGPDASPARSLDDVYQRPLDR